MDNKDYSELVKLIESCQEISGAELLSAKTEISRLDSLTLPSELSLDIEPPASAMERQCDESGGKEPAQDPRVLITQAPLPEKIKMALLGNAVCRQILIRDPTRMIPQFVLRNPRLQPLEVEEFAKNPNMSEHVLRSIAENQTWMRAYSLKLSIVANPKTPGDIALKWLRFLNLADLKRLSRSKNISQLVAVTARKRVAAMEKEGK